MAAWDNLSEVAGRNSRKGVTNVNIGHRVEFVRFHHDISANILMYKLTKQFRDLCGTSHPGKVVIYWGSG